MEPNKADLTPSGRIRASSDPLSRGGAFDGSGARLDQEPNPFEQSFSSGPTSTIPAPPDNPSVLRRARSNSPATPRSLIPNTSATNSAQGTNKLPPASMITSPGGGDLSQSGWPDSLKTGPLSPALLNGPSNSGQGMFDAAAFRSSFNPLQNGMPGSNGVSFPPPSPATAALFAMMTNNTPGTADGSAQSRPTENNQFEHSFGQAAGPGGVKPDDRNNYGPHVQSAPAPLNSLHRAALAQGHAGPNMPQLGQAHPYAVPPRAPYPMQMSQHGGNQNPLFLLSQAQDLSNVQDDAVVAAAALSNLGGPGGASSSVRADSSNPGSTYGDSPQPSSAGKPRRSTAASKRKQEADDDYDALQPASKKGPGKRGRKKKDEDLENAMNDGETEDEKRKNFLERNRQAALKCRQRKKAWLAQLQAKVEFLTADNDTLQQTVTNLKDEIASLRAILAAHSSCPVAMNSDRRNTVGMSVSQAQSGGQF